MDLSTKATVTTQTGVPVELPAVELTPDEAMLLGRYATWMSAWQLIAKLYCRDCGPAHEVEVFIDRDKIGIICQHRMLWYQGPVPVVLTTHPEAPALLVPVFFPTEVTLDLMSAGLLHDYDAFCRKHGLREALWCMACEEQGEASGVRPSITATTIELMCRCTRRTHRGLVQ